MFVLRPAQLASKSARPIANDYPLPCHDSEAENTASLCAHIVILEKTVRAGQSPLHSIEPTVYPVPASGSP